MTLTVSPWTVWAVLSLAFFGIVFWWRVARSAARDAWAWLADWLHGRIDPPWWWKPWLYRRAVDYGEDEPLEPLPPERTWEQMTHHDLPLVGTVIPPEAPTGPLSATRERIAPSLLGSRQAAAHFRKLERARERRWGKVSAEIWRAYEALGLEGTGFTRAMAATVRELAR